MSSNTNRKSKIQVQSSEMIFTNASYLEMKKDQGNLDSQETRHLVTEGEQQISVADNQYGPEKHHKQHLASTINLYLQKVTSDRNQTIAGTPDANYSKYPSTKIITMPISVQQRLSHDTSRAMHGTTNFDQQNAQN